MTATATGAQFEDIGRNEPCPCGSGNKYKKCCFRTHQVQREAQKQNRSVEALVKSDTIPWKMYTLLQQVNENNLLALYYDMTHEDGPFRKKYADKAAFVEAADAGEAIVVAGKGCDLREIRLDAPDVYLLMTYGLDDPRVDTIRYDIVTLRPNEFDAHGNTRVVQAQGFRIWDIQHHRRTKAELEKLDLSLGELGIEWHKPKAS